MLVEVWRSQAVVDQWSSYLKIKRYHEVPSIKCKVSEVSSKVLVEVGSHAVWGPVEQLAQMSALSLSPTPMHAILIHWVALEQ